MTAAMPRDDKSADEMPGGMPSAHGNCVAYLCTLRLKCGLQVEPPPSTTAQSPRISPKGRMPLTNIKGAAAREVENRGRRSHKK